MSNEPLGNTTRRGFLGTATAVTALTLTTPPAAEAQAAARSADEIKMAQLTADRTIRSRQRPVPATGRSRRPWQFRKRDTSNCEQGRYGPVFPRTPANYGFTVIAKVKPGRENAIREYGKTIEEAVKGDPTVLAPLRLHYLRWVLFDVGSGLHFMYQGIFDTDFDKYVEDAIALFNSTGITTVFVNLGRLARRLEDKYERCDQILSRQPEAKLSGIRRISVCQRGRSEESAQSQKLGVDHARPDAVNRCRGLPAHSARCDP